MQSAVLAYYPQAEVTYKFTNRGQHHFTRLAARRIRHHIDRAITSSSCFSLCLSSADIRHTVELAQLALSGAEKAWLKATCPYFTSEYTDYLAQFRFHPQAHAKLDFVSDKDNKSESDEDLGHINLEIGGLWIETILYEVSLDRLLLCVE